MEIDKIEFSNAYLAAINAKDISIDLSNISDFDVITSYETSGELVISINNLNTNISSLKEWIEVNLQETFEAWNDEIKTYCPDDFENYSDKENFFITDFTDFTYKDVSNQKENLEGRTFFEAYEFYIDQEGEEANRICNELKTYIKKGYGNLKFVEIVQADYDFDLIVLEDQLGNLMLFFPGTDDQEIYDIMYDFNKLYDREFGDKLKETLSVVGEAISDLPENLQKQVEEFLSDYPIFKEYDYNIEALLNDVQEGVNQQIKKYVDKYLPIAMERGVKLNFGGYSLGGGEAEIATKYAIEQDRFLSFSKSFEYNKMIGPQLPPTTNFIESLIGNTVGNLVLVNSYHANWTESEFLELLETGKVKAYSIYGDMPSGIYESDIFAPYTKVIYTDNELNITNFKSKKDGPNAKRIVEELYDVKDHFKYYTISDEEILNNLTIIVEEVNTFDKISPFKEKKEVTFFKETGEIKELIDKATIEIENQGVISESTRDSITKSISELAGSIDSVSYYDQIENTKSKSIINSWLTLASTLTDIDLPKAEQLESFNYAEGIIGTSHDVNNVDPNVAFDENGNACNYIKYEKKHVRGEKDKVLVNPTLVYMEELPSDWGKYHYEKIENISFSEQSKNLFGMDILPILRDTLESIEENKFLHNTVSDVGEVFYDHDKMINYAWEFDKSDNFFDKVKYASLTASYAAETIYDTLNTVSGIGGEVVDNTCNYVASELLEDYIGETGSKIVAEITEYSVDSVLCSIITGNPFVAIGYQVYDLFD